MIRKIREGNFGTTSGEHATDRAPDLSRSTADERPLPAELHRDCTVSPSRPTESIPTTSGDKGQRFARGRSVVSGAEEFPRDLAGDQGSPIQHRRRRPTEESRGRRRSPILIAPRMSIGDLARVVFAVVEEEIVVLIPARRFLLGAREHFVLR